MKALILVGGLGTRLREVVNDRPKPMALIAGRPFLEYLILQLRRYDITDTVLATGHLGEQIREYFQDGSRWGVRIFYSQEKELLGTGGAIKLAWRLIMEDKDFVVMNGDSFFNVDIDHLIEYHLENEALATMALLKIDNSERYGTVSINNKNKKITSFTEKLEHSKSKSNLINAGIYVLNQQILDYIPEGRVSLEKEVFPKLISKDFYGMPMVGDFIDIGVPEAYKRLLMNPQILFRLCEPYS